MNYYDDNPNSLKSKLNFVHLNLVNTQVLNELQQETSSIYSGFILRVYKKFSGNEKPIFINQSVFLTRGYLCLVWLWESIKSLEIETEILEDLEKHLDKRIFKFIFSGQKRKSDDLKDIINSIRNAISHGKVEAHEDKFVFKNIDPRKPESKDHWRIIEMSWEGFGELSEKMVEVVDEHFKKERWG